MMQTGSRATDSGSAPRIFNLISGLGVYAKLEALLPYTIIRTAVLDEAGEL